jgi:membrane-associated protease RseP (regulator of RpoE activity)
LLLTLGTTVTLGGAFAVATRTDVSTDVVPMLLPETISRVWTEPALLSQGLRFALPVLVILLAHELGHFFACRRHRLRVTPPYFLPAPVGLGTFGAFLRIRSSIRDRRQLVDVGVSGPIAGFVALLPFLVLGVAWSEPVSVLVTEELDAAAVWLYLPGESLLERALVAAFHGALDGRILNPHPFLIAAWVGMFATMLNLLPLAQFDGGHLLYAATGRRQHRLSRPLWLAVALLGLVWPGWWLWCVVALVLGLRHPPLADESAPLGRRGRWGIAAGLVIFALCFMPVPIRVVGLLAR